MTTSALMTMKSRYDAWAGGIKEGLRPVAVWYTGLTPRERRLVTAGGTVLGAFLLFTLLVEPAWNDVQHLQAQLPALRAQAATVASLTAEARSLQQKASHAGNGMPTTSDVADSLRRAGLPPATWDAADGPPDAANHNAPSWQIKLNAAPSDALMRWMDTLTADLRLRVASADLHRATSEYGRLLPGKVNGTVMLAPPQASGRH